MNNDDINQFIQSFDQFMNQSEQSIAEFYQRTNPLVKQPKRFDITKIPDYEKRAAQLEVTVDYYLQEFI